MNGIDIRLDRATARDLFDTLTALGEYWAAGAAIPYPPREVMTMLTAVYKEIARQAGFTTVADAMRAWHAKHGQQPGDASRS